MDYPILETPEVTLDQCKVMFSECTTVDAGRVIESFAALKGTGVDKMLGQCKRDITQAYRSQND